MTNVVQFPQRPSEPEDQWLFTARIVRGSSGRYYVYLDDICPVEFETDETASERMRRLGLAALEAAANMLAVADSLED